MLTTNSTPTSRLSSTKWYEIIRKTDPRCDPYLVWLDLTYEHLPETTGLYGLPRASQGRIELLVELVGDAATQVKPANELMSKLRHDYQFETRSPWLERGAVQSFVCGFLPVRKIEALSRAIADGGLLIRFELASARFLPRTEGMPRSGWRGRKFTEDGQANFSLTVSQSHKSFSLSSKSVPAPVPTVGSLPLVVVIDDLCNFASTSLSGRVRSIWMQGASGEVPQGGGTQRPIGTDPRPPVDYGVEIPIRTEPFAASKLGDFPAPATGERHAYARFDEARNDSRNTLPPQWSHGSAVLSMLTIGEPAPAEACPDDLHRLLSPPDIDFVQLPDVAVLDTTGGSLSGFALDAIHRAIVLGCHRQIRPDIIVNLSFGTHSGPHDGTSMFERALVDLLKRYNGRAVDDGRGGLVRLPTLHVVLPAGNSHIERTHATAWLPGKGTQRDLRWMIQPDTETDSFLEIWIGDDPEAKLERQNVEIEVELPNGERLQAPVKPGGIGVLEEKIDGLDVIRAAVIYPRTTSKGQKGTMALLAVAPTQRRAEFGYGERYRNSTDGVPRGAKPGQSEETLRRVRAEAPAGCWTVRIKNVGDNPVQFHAWIQRHDSAPGRRRSSKGYQGRQSYFVEAEGSAVDPCFTLNGIATASHPGQLWVVGAMDERGGIPLYSAAGPDRLTGARIEGPDAAPVVDRSRNVPGRHVAGVFSGSRLRLGGTSIGAAVFTRMLYHVLANEGCTTEWCEAYPPAPQPVRTAETPAMAEDWMRGALKRLRHKDQLVIPCGRCKAPGPAKK